MRGSVRALVAHASRVPRHAEHLLPSARPASANVPLVIASTMSSAPPPRQARCVVGCAFTKRTTLSMRYMSGTPLAGEGAIGGPAGTPSGGNMPMEKFFDVTSANFSQILNDRYAMHA